MEKDKLDEKASNKKITSFLKSKKFILIIFGILISFLLIHNIIIGSNVLNLHFISNFKNNIYLHDTENPIVYVDNIPMVDYGYKENIFIGLQYNPLEIAREGIKTLANTTEPLSNESINQAILLGNWLLSNEILKTSYDWLNESINVVFALWEYNFSLPSKDMTIYKPWYSSMAQAYIIQFFETLYKITYNSTFHEASLIAFNAFRVNVEKGGLILIESEGKIWLPEVIEVNDLNKKRFILNGFLFTLQSLISTSEIINSTLFFERFKDLEEKSIVNLVDKIKLYDYKGIWSYYDRNKNLATESYHKIHYNLLEYFYNRTNSSILLNYSQLWKNTPYNDFPRSFTWYIQSFWTETKIWLPYTILFTLVIDMIIIIIIILIKSISKKYHSKKNLKNINTLNDDSD